MPRELPEPASKRAKTCEGQFSDVPLIKGDLFYFYLEAFDESDDGKTYTVTFECIPVDVMRSFINGSIPQFQLFDKTTGIFTWQDVTKEQLISVLDPPPRINWEANYIEGSWYLARAEITLNESRDEQNHLVHIDSFINDPDTEVFSVNLNKLNLLSFPGTIDLRPSGDIVYYSLSDNPFHNFIPAWFGFDVYDARNTDRLLLRAFESPGEGSNEDTTFGNAITAPGDITSIGIMDLGIAGCNLLIAGDTPVCYFDAGSPLPAFNKTFPPGFTNPIEGFPVILSHWDWDHWSLVLRFSSLKTVVWHVNKRSPLSGKAAAFKAGQKTAGKLVEYTGPKTDFIKNIDLYLCSTSRNSGGFAKNNTGLAVVVKNLELGDKLGHVVLTGDANFNSAHLPGNLNVIGITAVHHGSKNEGASKNLPVPLAINKKTKVSEAFEGRIAYSYGMSNAGANKAWKRPYNFPAQLAIDDYRIAKWGKALPSENEVSTAEGILLNTTPKPTVDPEQPPHRGNIRMADQTALDPKYNTSSFFAIKHKLE